MRAFAKRVRFERPTAAPEQARSPEGVDLTLIRAHDVEFLVVGGVSGVLQFPPRRAAGGLGGKDLHARHRALAAVASRCLRPMAS